jgi:hypothetical protein
MVITAFENSKDAGFKLAEPSKYAEASHPSATAGRAEVLSTVTPLFGAMDPETLSRPTSPESSNLYQTSGCKLDAASKRLRDVKPEL